LEECIVIGGRIVCIELKTDHCLFFFVKMPIMRGYNTILKDINLSLVRLSDDCHRVQFKRRRAKKDSVKVIMKKRMDLILRTILKLQSIRGTLDQIHKTYGNSKERQRGKEEVESRMMDLDKLMHYFSQF